jgi:hypothetical protein
MCYKSTNEINELSIFVDIPIAYKVRYGSGLNYQSIGGSQSDINTLHTVQKSLTGAATGFSVPLVLVNLLGIASIYKMNKTGYTVYVGKNLEMSSLKTTEFHNSTGMMKTLNCIHSVIFKLMQ